MHHLELERFYIVEVLLDQVLETQNLKKPLQYAAAISEYNLGPGSEEYLATLESFRSRLSLPMLSPCSVQNGLGPLPRQAKWSLARQIKELSTSSGHN